MPVSASTYVTRPSDIYDPLGASQALEPLHIYRVLLERATAANRQSAFHTNKFRFAKARAELGSSLALEENWDSDGAEPPSPLAGRVVHRVLDKLELKALAPAQVMPSVEGGIGLTFVEGSNRAFIEVLNEGEIAAVIYSDRSEPETWEIGDTEHALTAAIYRIRVHLAS